MPPANTDIYWRYTMAYVAALSSKDAMPAVPKDDGTGVMAAIAIGLHDGKLNRPPRRLADVVAAVEVITSGKASESISEQF
jgi:hypothetical protein